MSEGFDPLPLFFPAHYFIGRQLIVLLINYTISDVLLWNSHKLLRRIHVIC